MPRNPFKLNKDYNNRPNRNSFDLSFSNNLTFNFGELIPVMCKETLPGDTFKIDSALGLRFMPLAFPIQTRCKAYIHFFYQRVRNLWKDFPDFVYGNDKLIGKKLVPPYIQNPDSGMTVNYTTGSLGDYLGLPTVSYYFRNMFLTDYVYFPPDFKPSFGKLPYVTNIDANTDVVANIASAVFSPYYQNDQSFPVDGTKWYYFPIVVRHDGENTDVRDVDVEITIPNGTLNVDLSKVFVAVPSSDTSKQFVLNADVHIVTKTNDSGVNIPYTVIRFRVPSDWYQLGNADHLNVVFKSNFSRVDARDLKSINVQGFNIKLDLVDSVFESGGNPLQSERLSVLPFRCYESIYNSFYRDDRNNPNYDNDGYLMYNSYLKSVDGGRDTLYYPIRYRNWELDQFTSCVASPQQGVAPLVGISSVGEVTFSYDGKEYKAMAKTADDADTITSIEFSENVPNSVARAALNASTTGISINDFRNVNALQRWLETNIRRGLKYKDQSQARWGVSPSDSVLGMPEFIGGYSVDVDINTVINTSAQGSVALGDYSGNATAFGGSKHQISHFCDDYGFVMAIVSVVPVPTYSQLLPKMFMRNDVLDYYSPEFQNLGLQPVLYKELCPLECGDSTIPMHKVFGYQRPWYDYMYSNDEVHGLFRTELSSFILSRQFLAPPSLDADFLTVNPDSLNNVFTVKQRHNILGQIRFNIDAQRPLPLYSIQQIN